jgi:hypothetical protein
LISVQKVTHEMSIGAGFAPVTRTGACHRKNACAADELHLLRFGTDALKGSLVVRAMRGANVAYCAN